MAVLPAEGGVCAREVTTCLTHGWAGVRRMKMGTNNARGYMSVTANTANTHISACFLLVFCWQLRWQSVSWNCQHCQRKPSASPWRDSQRRLMPGGTSRVQRRLWPMERCRGCGRVRSLRREWTRVHEGARLRLLRRPRRPLRPQRDAHPRHATAHRWPRHPRAASRRSHRAYPSDPARRLAYVR